MLARARRGDRDALAELYRSFAGPALGLALRLLGSRAKAEDVVHDAFLRAFEHLDGYRGDAPIGVWIKRLVLHAAIDRLRAERRRGGEPEPVDGLAASDPGPEPRLDVEGLLARLSPRARAVVWLHEVEGWPHAEIARRFGQSESWSKSVLSRALTRLRAEEKPR